MYFLWRKTHTSKYRRSSALQINVESPSSRKQSLARTPNAKRLFTKHKTQQQKNSQRCRRCGRRRGITSALRRRRSPGGRSTRLARGGEPRCLVPCANGIQRPAPAAHGRRPKGGTVKKNTGPQGGRSTCDEKKNARSEAQICASAPHKSSGARACMISGITNRAGEEGREETRRHGLGHGHGRGVERVHGRPTKHGVLRICYHGMRASAATRKKGLLGNATHRSIEPPHAKYDILPSTHGRMAGGFRY